RHRQRLRAGAPRLRAADRRAPRHPAEGRRPADGDRRRPRAPVAGAPPPTPRPSAREPPPLGRPIGGFGPTQQRLADMQTEIEAARALTWRAARLKDAGRPHSVEGAQAKLFASRVARQWTGEAIQVLGGYGYTKEF